jgi:hypothetical protein
MKGILHIIAVSAALAVVYSILKISHRWTECIEDECSHYHGRFQHHLDMNAALTAAEDPISGWA